MMQKFNSAEKGKPVVCWGDGTPMREFTYVDDLADACIYFLNKKTKESLINIGSGVEKTIAQYARFLIDKFKINLSVEYDSSKPNGTPRKILNTTTAKKYGWKSKISLDEGLEKVLKSLNNVHHAQSTIQNSANIVGMGIQHELNERAFQTGELSAINGEARTCNLGSPLLI